MATQRRITHNVIRQPLVLREKILLPTLHIKLGLAKQLVKALQSDSEAFKHVQAMFPKLSQAKVKGGIFHRTTDSTTTWLQGIRRQNDCFRKRCLAVISQCFAWFTANILQAWEQDVTKNALLAFSLIFFQAKFCRCERRVWRTFSLRYSSDGEVPRSMG